MITSLELYVYLEICLFFNHFLILNTLIFLLTIYFYALLCIFHNNNVVHQILIVDCLDQNECFCSNFLELKFGMTEEETFFLKLLLNIGQVQSRKNAHK